MRLIRRASILQRCPALIVLYCTTYSVAKSERCVRSGYKSLHAHLSLPPFLGGGGEKVRGGREGQASLRTTTASKPNRNNQVVVVVVAIVVKRVIGVH